MMAIADFKESSQADSGDRRNRGILFWICLLSFSLLPLFFVTYFPSQDGPVHVENAFIDHIYDAPEAAGFRQYYEPNRGRFTNLVTHNFLKGLLYFTSPAVAEKIAVAIFIVLFPLSILYALRALGRQNDFLALLAIPCAFGYFLHMGFYNFCYGFVLFFAAIGYWLRHQNRFTARSVLTLLVLMTFLFLVHLLSAAIAVLTMTTLAAGFALTDFKSYRQGKASIQDGLRRIGVIGLVSLPVLAGAIYFISKYHDHAVWIRPDYLLEFLVKLRALVPFSAKDEFISISFVLFFAVFTVFFILLKIVRRQFSRRDVLFAVAALLFLLYFASPWKIAEQGFINDRISLFPFFMLILWFGSQTIPVFAGRIMRIVAVLLALITPAYYASAYIQHDRLMGEYLSGAHLVRNGSTLLPLHYARLKVHRHYPRLALYADPLLHAASRIAVNQSAVHLNNYAAMRGHFPIRFRDQFNPDFKIARYPKGIESLPPDVDFLNYPSRSGGSVDYVLIWGAPEKYRGQPPAMSALSQLTSGYELIHHSPSGMTRLYRKKYSNSD